MFKDLYFIYRKFLLQNLRLGDSLDYAKRELSFFWPTGHKNATRLVNIICILQLVAKTQLQIKEFL